MAAERARLDWQPDGLGGFECALPDGTGAAVSGIGPGPSHATRTERRVRCGHV